MPNDIPDLDTRWPGLADWPDRESASSAIPDEPPSDQDIEDFKGTILAQTDLVGGQASAAAATERDWFVATALGCATASSIAGWPPTRATTHRAASGSITCRWNS